jgi:hypothetical protein
MDDRSYRLAKGAGQQLRLTVVGHFKGADAKVCCADIERYGAAAPFELIVDLSAMSGYDRETRQAFQDTLKRTRKQIHTITLVGTSAVFRMAAAAVCLYAGIRMRLFDSGTDLDLAG